MGERVEVSRIIHMIHATTDIESCRRLYQDALGGLVFSENYFPAEDRDAALLYVADFMVEPMAPRTPDDMSKGFARLTSKIGQSFHSFELGVSDGPAASKIFRDGGATVASDYGFFFFVRADLTGGVLLEVCDGKMPNDPYDRRGWSPDAGVGHACSVVRLDHIACVTADIEKARHFFSELVAGTMLADERVETPQPGRRIVIRVGGTDVAFLQPDDADSGPLGAFLGRPQSGIYAMVWQIADREAAKNHFAGKMGLRLTEADCAGGAFAIDPADFLGARHEFVVR